MSDRHRFWADCISLKTIVRQAIGVAVDIMDTAAERRKRPFPDLRKVIVDHEVEISGGRLTLNVTSAPVPDMWESGARPEK